MPGGLAFREDESDGNRLMVSGGQSATSLQTQESNALARQRLVYLSSCNTGADYQNDNMTGRMYWLGANNVVSHFHATNNNTSISWDLAFMTNILLGRSVGDSERRASLYLYSNRFLEGFQDDYPYGFSNETHTLGNADYRPFLKTALDDSEDRVYHGLPQLTYRTHGSVIDEANGAVKTLQGATVSEESALPYSEVEGVAYDVYVDEYGGVYWYYKDTNILYSYEPFIEHFDLGDTEVNASAAQNVVNSFLAQAGYSVTGCQVKTSNAYAKDYFIVYDGNSSLRLSFHLQSDSQGNVYLVRFAAHDYTA